MGCGASANNQTLDLAELRHAGPVPDTIPPLWSKVSPPKFRITVHKKEYITRDLTITYGSQEFLKMKCTKNKHLLYDPSTGAKIAYCKRFEQKYRIYKVGSPVFEHQSPSIIRMDGDISTNLYLYAIVSDEDTKEYMINLHRLNGWTGATIQYVNELQPSRMMALFANPPSTKKIGGMLRDPRKGPQLNSKEVVCEWKAQDGWQMVEAKSSTNDPGLLACLIILNEFFASFHDANIL